MAQRRDSLVKQLRHLQQQFPEFAEMLQGVIEAIETLDIDMGQENDW